MQTKTSTSTCNTAHGKPIGYYKDANGVPLKSFTYKFQHSAFTEDEEGEKELQEKNEVLTLAEQVKVRNAEKVGKARAAALAKELEARGVIKPTAENDEQILLKDIFDKLVLSKKYATTEEARAMASTVTGIDWAE